MIGCFGIFLGPPNPICEKTGIPKTIDMKIGFSRDGFHFYRPDRRAFIPSSRIKDHWNYGYIHPVNGGFVVNGDEMRLYFSTFSGNSPVFGKHMYAGGSVGVARMRRDGFAAMGEKDSCGSLLTRPLLFEEGSLYVNAEAADGWLGAEIIDAQSGKPLAGYELENCLCISGNGTKQKIIWKTQATVPASETGLQIRFVLDHSRLYAFWFSNSPTGASKGYFGAGGPGLTKAQDM